MQQTTSETVAPEQPRFGVDLKSTDVCYRQALWGAIPAQLATQAPVAAKAQPEGEHRVA